LLGGYRRAGGVDKRDVEIAKGVNSVVPRDVVVIGGGQSGLAAAWALQRRGITPIVLEAEQETVGSWARYYDSLTLFSPARYSALPGRAFPGDPDHYPVRDEFADYLRNYAKHLDADIRTGMHVDAVDHRDGRYVVTTSDGETSPLQSLSSLPAGSAARTARPCRG
jgi:putative flavoprotein involved in K+ transport